MPRPAHTVQIIHKSRHSPPPNMLGRPRAVRGQNHIGLGPQRAVFWARLRVRNIQPNARQFARPQSRDHRLLVHHFSPTDIDEKTARHQPVKQVPRDHFVRFRRARATTHHHMGLRHEFGQIGHFFQLIDRVGQSISSGSTARTRNSKAFARSAIASPMPPNPIMPIVIPASSKHGTRSSVCVS